MAKVCDNTSVGIIVRNDAGDILVIERKKFPFGHAAPAGHIDEFGSPELAARGELKEEVNLSIVSMELVIENQLVSNHCRRFGGDHHYWWVFDAVVEGEIVPSATETKNVFFANADTLQRLAAQTESYLTQTISEKDWDEIS